jgi:hypothetical protein
MKRQVAEWEKIFANTHLTKDSQRLYRQLLKLSVNKQTNKQKTGRHI